MSALIRRAAAALALALVAGLALVIAAPMVARADPIPVPSVPGCSTGDDCTQSPTITPECKHPTPEPSETVTPTPEPSETVTPSAHTSTPPAETLAYTGANDDQTVRLLQLAGAALLIGTAMVAALRVSTTRRRRH